MFAFPTLARTAFGLSLLLSFTIVGCADVDEGSTDPSGSSRGLLQGAAGIGSDDFHTGVLDPLWTVVDPQGDGTVSLVGAGTPDARLLLSVPAGTTHDAWTNNTALRAMQPASNDDFEIEVKFESEPTQQYQGQGLIVEQDASNYVRFDVYSSGSSLQVFASTFANGSAQIYANDAIAGGPITYLRLGRSGNQWTTQYSNDGFSWTTAASFSHALTVSAVGVFAGNFSPNPAYTAVVDYFFETSAPIPSEDPPSCTPGEPLVLTTQTTNGTILRSPDQSSYTCGDVVTVTAQPDVGATFLGWGGALSGTTNPSSVTMNADTTVTASFDIDTSPPQVSNLNVAPTLNSAVVSWQTDELSTGFVEYGVTTAYELGSVASSTQATAHSVTLPALLEGQLYHYRVTAADVLANATTGADATFTTGITSTGSVVSDDFHTGVLNTSLWTVVDPQGDGTVSLTGEGTPDAQLLLSVPAGTTHDAWTSNTALRVMQPAVDDDLEIEVKFESAPTQAYQGQGLLVEQDASNYVRFDVYSNGSSLQVFAATFTNGSPQIYANDAIATGPTTYLRLGRSGNQWTAQYSNDGSSWTTAASFSRTMTVSSAGVFASNFNPNPAYTAVVDYFFDNVSPIAEEDPPLCDPGDALILTTQGTNGAILRNPDQGSYTCGDVVTLTAQPDVGATFVGWGGALSGATSPASVTMNADTSVTASFLLDTSPPLVSNVNVTPTETSAGVSWQTNELSTGVVEFGLTTAYELGSVASGTLATAHGVTLPGLTEGTVYHYRITAQDSFGNSVTGGDTTFTTVDICNLTTQATNGTITRSPNQSSYLCGSAVTLTAEPNVGATFTGWSGGLSGTANPSSFTINSDTTVTASFLLDTSPPLISNVNVAPTETSAVVSWQSDELSTGVVEFGLTTGYELGSVTSSTLATAHAATLPGLVEGQVYHYRITAQDSFGNSVTGGDATFTTTLSVCVLTTQSTNGTILRNPDQSSYTCGTVVTLTAQPNAGATFTAWGGALNGTVNPTTLAVTADTTVTATFALDTTPPQLSNVNATPSSSSALVDWQTDEDSIGFVEFGVTTSYELGSVASNTLATAHAVTLPGLLEGLIYHYRITAEDSLGNSVTGTDATFTTTTSGGGTGGAGGAGGAGGSPPSGAILSDDFFTGVLNTSLWEVVDPQGDGTVDLAGAGTPDAHLVLSVPAGTTHDAWSDNTTLRVMQPAADEDLEIEVKFESEPSEQYQGQGLLVEQDPTNYVRFDVYSNGSSLKVFTATFSDGSPDIYSNDTITTAGTTYLRIGRSGDQWTTEYSYDGTTWTTAASFSHPLAVSSVGVFAANFSPNPAFTAVVDYFFDTGAPIEPEDASLCDPGEQFTLTATAVGSGVVARAPDQSSYACGDVVVLTAQPSGGASFLGWGGALGGTANPASVTVTTDTNVTATFELDTSPPQVSGINATVLGNSATVSWQTDELSTGFVEHGLTTAYELGSVASSTLSTTHAVSLAGLVEGQVYHYRITAEDSLGNSTSSADATFNTTTGGPDINVWYGDSQSFGTLGTPQRWVNVLGQVSDPDGIASLTYSLNGGPQQPLSLGPFRRLAEPGDFNVELGNQELSPGANTIEIRAEDGLGFQNAKTVTINYATGNVWPLGYQVDWSSANDISDVAQVVDGRWSIVGGELRNDIDRYDRLVAIGDLSWTDYEVTVPVTVHSIDPAGFGGVNGAPGVGVILRWTGHFDWNGSQPTYGYYPTGGGGWVEFAANGDGELRLDDFTPGGLYRFDPLQRVIAIGTRYIWKIRVESQQGGSTQYQMKVWVDGSAEPANWEVVESDPSDVAGGSLLLIAHFADVSFGNVVINPL